MAKYGMFGKALRTDQGKFSGNVCGISTEVADPIHMALLSSRELPRHWSQVWELLLVFILATVKIIAVNHG